jgi:hypothetical protein
MAKTPNYGRDPNRPEPRIHQLQPQKTVAAALKASQQHVAYVNAAAKK